MEIIDPDRAHAPLMSMSSEAIRGGALSPDGARMYIREASRIHVIDLEGGAIVRSYSPVLSFDQHLGGVQPSRFDRVLYMESGYCLSILDLQTGETLDPAYCTESGMILCATESDTGSIAVIRSGIASTGVRQEELLVVRRTRLGP